MRNKYCLPIIIRHRYDELAIANIEWVQLAAVVFAERRPQPLHRTHPWEGAPADGIDQSGQDHPTLLSAQEKAGLRRERNGDHADGARGHLLQRHHRQRLRLHHCLPQHPHRCWRRLMPHHRHARYLSPNQGFNDTRPLYRLLNIYIIISVIKRIKSLHVSFVLPFESLEG